MIGGRHHWQLSAEARFLRPLLHVEGVPSSATYQEAVRLLNIETRPEWAPGRPRDARWRPPLPPLVEGGWWLTRIGAEVETSDWWLAELASDWLTVLARLRMRAAVPHLHSEYPLAETSVWWAGAPERAREKHQAVTVYLESR